MPHIGAGVVGHAPANWVANFRLVGVPAGAGPLPVKPIDRATVRAICQNPANPVLFGYVCCMAWGGQGTLPGTGRYVTSSWGAKAVIGSHLMALRNGRLTRCQAYNLFSGTGAVKGLGPAFMTKLLYFFSPLPNNYIMDQWTAKSVNLLTGNWVVRMTPGGSVHNQNKCGNYQAYCDELDSMAKLIGGVTGEQVEEMLMSQGKPALWPWRAHVRANWARHAPAGNYSSASLCRVYKHIPTGCF